MEILSSCYHHEFFLLVILVATIRQLVDSMELGLQEIAIPVHATGGVHRTLCRTHFSHAHSLSGSVVRKSSITYIPCTRKAQDEAVCISCATCRSTHTPSYPSARPTSDVPPTTERRRWAFHTVFRVRSNRTVLGISCGTLACKVRHMCFTQATTYRC